MTGSFCLSSYLSVIDKCIQNSKEKLVQLHIIENWHNIVAINSLTELVHVKVKVLVLFSY